MYLLECLVFFVEWLGEKAIDEWALFVWSVEREGSQKDAY